MHLGIVVVAPAGNTPTDVSNISPASAALVITAGALTRDSARFGDSAFGPSVDLWAPGERIRSCWPTALVSLSGDATNTLWGTEGAGAFVAGAAALVLSQYPPDPNIATSGITPEEVRAKLLNNALDGYLYDLGEGSLNKLLYVGRR